MRRSASQAAMCDGAGRMLLYQPVQRGLLGAVAFVVETGADRRHRGSR